MIRGAGQRDCSSGDKNGLHEEGHNKKNINGTNKVQFKAKAKYFCDHVRA